MTEVKPHLNWLTCLFQSVCAGKLPFKICACSWDLLQACFLCGQRHHWVRPGGTHPVTWEDALGLFPSQANLNYASNVLQTIRVETARLNIACKRACVCFGRDPVWCNTAEAVKCVVNEKVGSSCLFLIACVSLILMALTAVLRGSCYFYFFCLILLWHHCWRCISTVRMH